MFNSIFLQEEEGGVLLTTYDIVRINYKQIRGDSFNNDDGDEEGTSWNYVILDEGDRIKNPKTQRAQSLFEIPCAHRIVITGTPIQNYLKVYLIPFLSSSNLYMIYYMLCNLIIIAGNVGSIQILLPGCLG